MQSSLASSTLPEPWFVPADSGFGIDNLPFGVFSPKISSEGEFDRQVVVEARKICSRIGDWVIDLHGLAKVINSPLFADGTTGMSVTRQVQQALMQPTLNCLADLGPASRRKIRRRLQVLLVEYTSEDVASPLSIRGPHMIHVDHVKMHMPFDIGDYTDFYAGIYHAEGVGKLFRPTGKALQDNYLHLPVGYHGRSSSIVVSGTPITRPMGQITVPSLTKFGEFEPEIKVLPSKKLDYEVELGCFIGMGNDMGIPIPINEAPAHIFGYVLLNDWSARDIQAFEYVPLGPFNGKNFATSISPWVVTPEALEFATGEGVPHPNPKRLRGYLYEETPDVVQAAITTSLTKGGEFKKRPETRVLSQVDTRSGLLWSFPQMIAHHTLGGCPLRPGDLFGSGTISGPMGNGKNVESRGSLLEITQNGRMRVPWEGHGFTFLEDGDVVHMSACADYQGRKIAFGEVTGRILPCPNPNPNTEISEPGAPLASA